MGVERCDPQTHHMSAVSHVIAPAGASWWLLQNMASVPQNTMLALHNEERYATVSQSFAVSVTWQPGDCLGAGQQ